MADSSEPIEKTPNEKAEYIERMSLELGRLATASGFPFLAYLLDMAAEEAQNCKASGNRLKLRSQKGDNVTLDTLGTRPIR